MVFARREDDSVLPMKLYSIPLLGATIRRERIIAMRDRRSVWIGLVSLLAVAMLSACDGGSRPATTERPTNTQSPTTSASPVSTPTTLSLVPTMADCISDAYDEDVSRIDSIRADTISRTNPSELTDAQRFEWYEFFERKGSRLKRSCVALWSEEVTEENADKRNEQYGRGPGEGCIDWVQRRAREVEPEFRATWDDALALLERPYLSLTVAERFALRSQIDDSSDCQRYYPQLFSGRWIPLQGSRQ